MSERQRLTWAIVGGVVAVVALLALGEWIT